MLVIPHFVAGIRDPASGKDWKRDIAILKGDIPGLALGSLKVNREMASVLNRGTVGSSEWFPIGLGNQTSMGKQSTRSNTRGRAAVNECPNLAVLELWKARIAIIDCSLDLAQLLR